MSAKAEVATLPLFADFRTRANKVKSRYLLKPEQRADFMRRSYGVYRQQLVRGRELLEQKTVQFDAKMFELDFSLDFFRMQMEDCFGSPCPYCGETLRFKNVAGDHVVPISRDDQELAIAQRFSWTNYLFCCKRCNRRKGNLTAREFCDFMTFLAGLADVARADILGRLSSVPLSFWFKRKGKTAKGAPQPEEDF